jgi:hypothetical protein
MKIMLFGIAITLILMLCVNCEPDSAVLADSSVMLHPPLLTELLDKIEELNDNEKDELFFMFDEAEDKKFLLLRNETEKF